MSDLSMQTNTYHTLEILKGKNCLDHAEALKMYINSDKCIPDKHHHHRESVYSIMQTSGRQKVGRQRPRGSQVSVRGGGSQVSVGGGKLTGSTRSKKDVNK